MRAHERLKRLEDLTGVLQAVVLGKRGEEVECCGADVGKRLLDRRCEEEKRGGVGGKEFDELGCKHFSFTQTKTLGTRLKNARICASG